MTMTVVLICNGCGAGIRWITTLRGSNMPVDPEPVRSDGTAKTLITERGATISKPRVGMVGYVPHWWTCPAAEKLKGRIK